MMRGKAIVRSGVLAAVVAVGCTAAGSDNEALRRGDQAYARGDLTEALAEYRFALVQGGDDPQVLARTAHTYARTGRVTEAGEHYRQAVALDPTLADLAASDLLRVASRAIESNDGTAAAAAVDAATRIEPGVSLAGISLPLARHFARSGQYAQALPFFQKAVRESPSNTTVIFEMAIAHQELGDCRRALVFFEQVRGYVTPAQRSEVDWNIGSCSADLAAEARADDDLEEALRLYRTTIEIGEPRNRLAATWFEVGEILSSRGECDAALNAFEQVQEEDFPGGLLLERARARVDQIRFGRGDGPC